MKVHGTQSREFEGDSLHMTLIRKNLVEAVSLLVVHAIQSQLYYSLVGHDTTHGVLTHADVHVHVMSCLHVGYCCKLDFQA